MTDRKEEALAQARALVEDMVKELHFRGCDETHPMIRRAMELIPQLKAMEDRQAFEKLGAQAPPAADKLHLMDPEQVASMDDPAIREKFSKEEMIEAAFTFENELMAVLGDENAMSYDIYTGMSETELVSVIKAAVENICRLRS